MPGRRVLFLVFLGLLFRQLGLLFLLLLQLLVVFFRRFLHLLGNFGVLRSRSRAGVEDFRSGECQAKDNKRNPTFSFSHKFTIGRVCRDCTATVASRQ